MVMVVDVECEHVSMKYYTGSWVYAMKIQGNRP